MVTRRETAGYLFIFAEELEEPTGGRVVKGMVPFHAAGARVRARELTGASV